MAKVPPRKRKEVIELRKQGKTYTAISLFTGVPRDYVQKIIKEVKKK
ncbi:helix-turn-helix domain-containing protein [Clostridium tyrobutyricum]|nr:helix-turn-helix domain-containing protein [Clostridium tyrobutyricum]